VSREAGRLLVAAVHTAPIAPDCYSQVAAAMLQSDQALNGGRNRPVLNRAFAQREILAVAIDEMAHLVAVWNITSALGGSPRFGRGDRPLDPGGLPASVVVRLAPFTEAVLQHFIYLERPAESAEPDGDGFAPEFVFRRGIRTARLTPMGLDYVTVGAFYATLSLGLPCRLPRT